MYYEPYEEQQALEVEQRQADSEVLDLELDNLK